jgi:hypothetical protein
MATPRKPRVTCSALDRLMTCEAAAVLDAIDRSNAAGDRGTAVHRFLANISNGQAGLQIDYGDTPNEVVAWINSITDLPEPGIGDAEIAFAYNVETGECAVVGHDIGRNYPETDRPVIFGSADLVLKHDGGNIEVIDYKSGREAPPPTSWQMRALALLAARSATFDVSTVTTTIAHIRDDGSIDRESATMSAADLDDTADALAELYARVMVAWEARQAGLMPKTTPSDEACRWCACRSQCPEFTTATVAIVPAMRNALSLADIDTAPDDLLREHYDRVQRAKALVAEHEAAIETRAAAKPLQLANGDVLTLAPGEARDKIDDAIAAAVLTQRYGADVALSAASYSKTGITKALGASDGKAAIAAIRDAGGVTSQPTAAKVRVVKAEAKALPRKRGGKAA